jgi:hypothetical protein
MVGIAHHLKTNPSDSFSFLRPIVSEVRTGEIKRELSKDFSKDTF